MLLLLIGTALWLLATALVVALGCALARLLGNRPKWRRIWQVALVSLPLHLFASVPVTLGYIGAGMVNTRHDERAYRGPRFSPSGEWLVQSRATLKDGPPSDTPTKPAEQVELRASDGTALRAYFVPATGTSRAPIDAVLVHGLFRGGLELETVGRWLRELGCDVLMLELRSHGQSQRVQASFGPREASDVAAACAWFARRQGAAQRELLLFGVSLGTVAVSLAAPDAARLRYLVLDAPVVDPEATAVRMLARGPRGRTALLGLPRLFGWLTMRGLEFWAGTDFASIRTLQALPKLPRELRALVIGAGEDERVTAEDVAAAHAALPCAGENKQLWIEPGAEHGAVWEKNPQEYQSRLRWLLGR